MFGELTSFNRGSKYFLYMNYNYLPGDYVINPKNEDWGIGQVQSIINDKVTVNFENKGKQVINSNKIILEKVKDLARK